MIKHGQKVFLRKKLKRIRVVSPFEVYCPGFYTSDFRVEIEQGSTFPVRITPVSDDPDITFEPSEITFDANDFLDFGSSSSKTIASLGANIWKSLTP